MRAGSCILEWFPEKIRLTIRKALSPKSLSWYKFSRVTPEIQSRYPPTFKLRNDLEPFNSVSSIEE